MSPGAGRARNRLFEPYGPDPRIHPSSLIRLSKRTPHDGQGCVKLLSANDHRSFPKLIMTRVDRDGVKRLVTGWEYVHIAIDDATRLAYAEVLGDEKATTAIGFL